MENGVHDMLYIIWSKELKDEQLAAINERHNGKMKQAIEADIEWMFKQRGNQKVYDLRFTPKVYDLRLI